MKIAIITANLSNCDSDYQIVEQYIPECSSVDVIRYNNVNFPLKPSSTPRAQAKIPKMLGWELNPNYDYYIWMDSTFEVKRADSIMWLISLIEGDDFLFFKHPHRATVKQEYEYLESEILKKNKYIEERYAGEHYNGDWFNTPLQLLAAGVFMYRNLPEVRAILRNWYYQTIRYNINDQLSLPYVIDSDKLIRVKVIDHNILHNKYFIHHNHK